MILTDKQECLNIIATYDTDKAIDIFKESELSQDLKSDKELAKSLVSLSGYFLKKFSTKIRDNKEIVRMAVLGNEDGNFPFPVIKEASARLRKDIPFLSNLIRQKDVVYYMLDENIKVHPDILMILYKRNLSTFASSVFVSTNDCFDLIKTLEQKPKVIAFLKDARLESKEYVKQFKENTDLYRESRRTGPVRENYNFNHYSWSLIHCLERMSKEDLKSLPFSDNLPDVNDLINDQRQKNTIYEIKQDPKASVEKKKRKLLKLF